MNVPKRGRLSRIGKAVRTGRTRRAARAAAQAASRRAGRGGVQEQGVGGIVREAARALRNRFRRPRA